MSALSKQFTAALQRSPSKGGWTYVVMPGRPSSFGTRCLVKVSAGWTATPSAPSPGWPPSTSFNQPQPGSDPQACDWRARSK